MLKTENKVIPGRAALSVCRRLIIIFFILTAGAAAYGAADGEYPSPFVRVAETVAPSVVQITTTRIEVVRRSDPFEGFERFFEGPAVPEQFREFFERQPRQREQRRRREGLGSGVIISGDGYIVTNYHVIADVDEIQVKLLQKDRLFDAEVVGIDEVTDLAVIKITPEAPLAPAVLGDSGRIRIGEWAIAIGNPFGLEETVTVGVISALGRAGFHGLPRYQDFIQTDASINLGNSGGALVNIKGEVIGINTFIMSPYIAQGLGFAIPINIVKNVYGKLVEHGHIRRGYLGVIPQDLTPAMARMWNLPDTEGVVIAHVQPDTAASRGGLRVQDVVIEFDGQKVTGEEQFRRMIADTPAEKDVIIKIIRDGEEKILTARLDELPGSGRPAQKEEDSIRLGFEAGEITPELQERYGIEEPGGVIVTEIRGGTLAERALRRGDIIQKINMHPVKNMEDFRKAARDIRPGEEVVLLVRRAGHTLFVEIRAE